MPFRFLVWTIAAALFAGLVAVLTVDGPRGEAPGDGPTVRREGGSVTVTDASGRSLTLAAAPRRVLPCDAALVDMVTALVPPDRIVAIPEQAEVWSRLAESAAGFADHPRFFRFEAESALAHRPDLVLASPFSDPDTVGRLEALGVAVLRLPVRDDLDDVERALLTLGEVLGVPGTAEALVADLERRRAELARRTAGRGHLRVATYANHGTGGWTFGRRSTLDAVIRLAGMRNAVAELDRTGSTRLTYEELLLLDPDVILVSRPAPGAPDPTRELIGDDPVLAALAAVRNDAVVALPPRLMQASSQEILAAAERLADEVEALAEAGRVARRDGDGRR